MKSTIESMQELAKKKNGKCISTEYNGTHKKLIWQCEKNHIWEATPSNIKRGKWCPKCARNIKYTIEEISILAKSKNGEVISTEYKGSHVKLKWKCEKEHIWESTPANIRKGKWCPECAGLKPKTLAHAQSYAKRFGGKCISTEYINNRANLIWECNNGHQWKATLTNVTRGTWCPICSSSIGERFCRAIFEKIFNKKFPKVRPKWLIGNSGRLLELDGYNSELNLAFEYQGEQHKREIEFYTKKRTFENQIENDKLKKELCKLNKVILIEINYVADIKKMKKEIIKQLKLNKISFPKKRINIDNLLKETYSHTLIEEMKDIALKNGGQCLSKNYVNNNTKLTWKCNKKHIWKTTPASIKMGHWCPKCGGSLKLSLNEMQKLAEIKNGKCLSNKYANGHTKLIWQCEKGHIWTAIPTSIKRGSWCPKCKKSKNIPQ